MTVPAKGSSARPTSAKGSASARQITAAELRATEREKVRLSIELHDGVGQHLTGIAFLAKALANRLRRLGVQIVEAPAGQIGPALLSRYLDLKRRDLL